jgi:two-component system, response regulator YesN
MRLLIADRDSTERIGIKWLLTSISMSFTDIHQSADLVSLMKKLEEYKPDVLLVELEMIPPSSWDAFLHVMEKYAGIIIAMTTEAVFERAWQAIQLQSSGLLIKPLSPDRIRRTISIATRSKRKKEITISEVETAQNQYASLFIDTKAITSNVISMMVVQPESKKDIKELSDWLDQYSFVQKPYILPLREHVVCLLPTYTNEMIYQEAQRIVREDTVGNGSKLFIAVSSIGYSSITIHVCYERALQALKMIFFKGHQQIIEIQNVPVFLNIDPFLTPAEQRIWMSMLEEGDKAAIKRWLYQQFTEFPEGYPDPDLLRIRLTSILAHLRRFMQTYKLEKVNQVEIRYQEIFQTILHEPVLYRIVQEVLLFIYYIMQHAHNQKENAFGDIIERALRYIDEYYHRSDLSLEKVATYVQRSPSYFSHILSAKRGQTFRQYLQNIRIKQAKYLLSSSSLNVREVSFAVGYEDPNYFSRLFKEYTGYSPRIWRKEMIKQ